MKHIFSHHGFGMVETLISALVFSIALAFAFKALTNQSRQALSLDQQAKESFTGTQALRRFALDVRRSGSNQALDWGTEHTFEDPEDSGQYYYFGVNPEPENNSANLINMVSFYARTHPMNPATGFFAYSHGDLPGDPLEDWPSFNDDLEWPANPGDKVIYRLKALDPDDIKNDLVRTDIKEGNDFVLAKNLLSAEIHYRTDDPRINFPTMGKPETVVKFTPEGRSSDDDFDQDPVSGEFDRDFIAYVQLILTFEESGTTVAKTKLDSGPIRKWVRR